MLSSESVALRWLTSSCPATENNRSDGTLVAGTLKYLLTVLPFLERDLHLSPSTMREGFHAALVGAFLKIAEVQYAPVKCKSVECKRWTLTHSATKSTSRN